MSGSTRSRRRRSNLRSTDAALGAEYTREAGHLWPFGLVHAFADGAGGASASSSGSARRRGLARTGDRVTGVSSVGRRSRRTTSCSPRTPTRPQLLPDLPAGAIVPARGQILVTQPVPKRSTIPSAPTSTRNTAARCLAARSSAAGIRRLDDGRGARTLRGARHPAGALRHRQLPDDALTLMAGVKVVRCWAGIMGFTADGLPLIGRAALGAGLTIAAGFNGGGFSWGAISRQNRRPPPDRPGPRLRPDPLRPHPLLHGGTELGQPLYGGGEEHCSAGARRHRIGPAAGCAAIPPERNADTPAKDEPRQSITHPKPSNRGPKLMPRKPVYRESRIPVYVVLDLLNAGAKPSSLGGIPRAHSRRHRRAIAIRYRPPHVRL